MAGNETKLDETTVAKLKNVTDKGKDSKKRFSEKGEKNATGQNHLQIAC